MISKLYRELNSLYSIHVIRCCSAPTAMYYSTQSLDVEARGREKNGKMDLAKGFIIINRFAVATLRLSYRDWMTRDRK